MLFKSLLVLLWLTLLSTSSLAQISGLRTDQLGAGAAPSDSDLLTIEQGGVIPNKQISLGTLKFYVNSSGIASTSITCGSSCTFTVGTASSVGTLSAVMSPVTPRFTGAWTLQTTGSVGGHTCDNSGFFSITGGNTLHISASATANTYQVCYVATQLGATASPFPNVVAVSNTSALAGFVIAPTGNDSTGAGTLASPWQTLQKCQTAMQGAIQANKVCNLRAGTYSSGNGYTTQTTGALVTEALFLTSADTGGTWQEYPPDFPSNGVSSAIIDGNAGSSGANCPQNAIGAGVHRAILMSGVQNAVISNLQFQNFCFSAVSMWGNPASYGCWPISGGTTTGNVIKNNVAHDFYSQNAQCNGSQLGDPGAFDDTAAPNNTWTNNAIYNNTGMAIRAGILPGSGQSVSGTVITYNYIYNTNLQGNDQAAIYVGQDINATGIQVLYNYVASLALGTGCTLGTPGECVNNFYWDDGVGAVTATGNVGITNFNTGSGYFNNGSNSGSQPHAHTGNIADMTNQNGATTFVSKPMYMQNSGGNGAANAGAITWANNIIIANSAACNGGSNQCMGQQNGFSGPTTLGPNAYWNYNAAGNSYLNSNAISFGDSSPNDVNVFGNATSRCPSTNGFPNVNSWSYFIPPGSAVFGSPVNFPAQPAGWGTPGFWGPPGYVLPHQGVTPSYGPTC